MNSRQIREVRGVLEQVNILFVWVWEAWRSGHCD
jgi:hypothetical protein